MEPTDLLCARFSALIITVAALAPGVAHAGDPILDALPSDAVCGDGWCGADETPSSCVADCVAVGAVVPPMTGLDHSPAGKRIIPTKSVASLVAALLHVDINTCDGAGVGSPEDPFCVIQLALDAAQDGDEVVVAPGTYHEKINFLGKAVTLRSSDGADVTTIDGTGLNDSVVKCISFEGSDTVLDGFTITGGTGTPDDEFNPRNWFGGGMLNALSSPTVLNCKFTGNSGSPGGGMANAPASPTVTDCIFAGNTGFNAGGMFNVGNSSPAVTNCKFIGNSVGSRGGGMSNSTFSRPTVIGCTFSGNVAGGGGGMRNFRSIPAVINCTFTGNRATGAIGGRGGGMSSLGQAQPRVTNCVLWANADTSGVVEAAQITDEFSLTTVTYSLLQGLDTFANTGNIDGDPLFVSPDGPDGIPGTLDDNLELSPASPCIDAGTNFAIPANISTDLNGRPRFVDDVGTPDTGVGQPPIVDMGAYEFGCGFECCVDAVCPDDNDFCTTATCVDGTCVQTDNGNCGACCDSAPGLAGSCTYIRTEECVGALQTSHTFTTCDDVACDEVTGACCDGLTGNCFEAIEGDCPNGSHTTWTLGAACADISCSAAVGACCDTGTNDPTVANCTQTAKSACDCTKCDWTKGVTCNVVECLPNFQTIPTVSEWGMAVVALFLLILAKLSFGQRAKSNQPCRVDCPLTRPNV